MAIVTEHLEESRDERTNILPPQGPRVRWTGVMSGFFIALGVLLVMGALGVAIGVTAFGDPRQATGETASDLGIGAGIWAFITVLVAVFLGGMVSTKVTDRPDRPGAVMHGALVWVLFFLFTLWMIANGVSLGLSGLFSAVSGLARGATTAVVAGGGDLVQRLGLNDPNQVLSRLDDPATASTLATATGMSVEEARTSLANLRSRVESVRDDPARVAAEVRNYLAQYSERVKQQALEAAAAAQRGATVGAWITFAVMVVSLGVAIAGAMGGVPSFRRWRARVVAVSS
jgi:signal transduction histidine kinase